MIKELVLMIAISYLTIAFAWYCIFTYQFKFRMTINIDGETLYKDFKGLELAIICLLWVIFLPIVIIQTKKHNEEE